MENILEGEGSNSLFDVAVEALLLVDDAGHVVAANQAARRILGYEAGPICGLEVEMLMPAQYRAAHHQHRRHFLGNPYCGTMKHGRTMVAVGPGGQEKRMDISLTPITSLRKPCVLVGLHDVSDRTQAEVNALNHEVLLAEITNDMAKHRTVERRLRQRRHDTDSLLGHQEAMHTVTALVHELNQPLAAVSVYSEVALHEINGMAVPDKLKHALCACMEQAHLAGQAVNLLIEFMQKGDINKEPMDINELAQDVLASAQHDGCDGFDSVLDLGHDLPMVLANRIQVQRILNNLIRNGIEAARATGMPCNSVMIRVKTAEEHGMAQVTIQDNGPGIDADMNDKVFKPFFTTKPHGIGMGLAVSEALAKANGGCLWVDRNGSPGATFHLALPFFS